MKATFTFFGKELPYRREGLGVEGERCIEIPIAIEFLRLFPLASIVEIGAVMPYHEERLAGLYTVVDPFDPWPGCVREDGEKAEIKGKNVLCISTLEHLGTSWYGNTDIDEKKGCRTYNRITKEAAHYLVTVPIGENPTFDAYVRASRPTGFMYRRISKANEWEPLPRIAWDFNYDDPFPWGNGVLFVTDLRFP